MPFLSPQSQRGYDVLCGEKRGKIFLRPNNVKEPLMVSSLSRLPDQTTMVKYDGFNMLLLVSPLIPSSYNACYTKVN
jgi:hypothetical protein